MKCIAAFLKGIAKSRTMAFSFVLAVLGGLQMYIDLLRPIFRSQEAFGWFCMGIAIIVAILRVLTYQSLPQLGNSAATDGTIPPSG